MQSARLTAEDIRKCSFSGDPISYVGWPQLFDDTNLHVFNFLIEHGLKKTDNLLDIGAGCLGPGRHIIKYLKRYAYCGIEPNIGLLNIAMDQIKGLSPTEIYLYAESLWRIDMVLSDWLGPGKSPDVYLAHSIFTHTGVELLDYIVANVAGTMALSSRFYATYYEGDHPTKTDNSWIYPGGVSLTKLNMVVAGEKAGLGANFFRPNHPAGHTWVEYFVRE